MHNVVPGEREGNVYQVLMIVLTYVMCSGVARPQATGAMAWGVARKFFVYYR